MPTVDVAAPEVEARLSRSEGVVVGTRLPVEGGALASDLSSCSRHALQWCRCGIPARGTVHTIVGESVCSRRVTASRSPLLSVRT